MSPDMEPGAIRILLVENHQLMLWGLQKLIEEQAPRMQTVATATTWEDAVAKCRACRPDVILLKLELDGCSGLDVLPALIEQCTARPLVLSDRRADGLVDAAIRAGALGVLHPDSPPSELIKAIERTSRGELWLDREASSRLLKQFLVPRVVAVDPEQERQASLTAREREVLRKVVELSGRTNRIIAESLFISEATLRNHLTSIYNKLGVTSRLELYVYAQQQGMIPHVHDLSLSSLPPKRAAWAK